MTSKSKLYELIQVSQNGKYPVKIDRPSFTYRDNYVRHTNAHNFTCVANITINGSQSTFESDVFSSKKDANLDVCQKIYDLVTNSSSSETDVTSSSRMSDNYHDEIIIDQNLLILIDYENVSMDKEIDRLQRFLDRVIVYSDSSEEDYEEDHHPIEVIKFAGHASSMKDRADIVVRSTRRDAVDHYIGFYLGQTLGQTPSMRDTHSIHILSRDRFASCLSDFCPNVTHNVDVDHLIESIREMSH